MLFLPLFWLGKGLELRFPSRGHTRSRLRLRLRLPCDHATCSLFRRDKCEEIQGYYQMIVTMTRPSSSGRYLQETTHTGTHLKLGGSAPSSFAIKNPFPSARAEYRYMTRLEASVWQANDASSHMGSSLILPSSRVGDPNFLEFQFVVDEDPCSPQAHVPITLTMPLFNVHLASSRRLCFSLVAQGL